MDRATQLSQICRGLRLVPHRLSGYCFKVCEFLSQVSCFCEFYCDELDPSVSNNSSFSSAGFPELSLMFGCESLHLFPSFLLDEGSLISTGVITSLISGNGQWRLPFSWSLIWCHLCKFMGVSLVSAFCLTLKCPASSHLFQYSLSFFHPLPSTSSTFPSSPTPSLARRSFLFPLPGETHAFPLGHSLLVT